MSQRRDAKTQSSFLKISASLRLCGETTYQINFAAICTTRPGPEPVMRPNVVDEMLVTGLLKFTSSKVLKTSPRSCMLRPGPRLRYRRIARSVVESPGP